jgi:hypothetical protein
LIPFINPINDFNSGFVTYTGSWSGAAVPSTRGFENNDAHWSNTAGAKYQVTWSGTDVQILSDRCAHYGYAEVKIDGVYRGRYDGYGAGACTGRQVVWSASGLPSSTNHTIEVTVLGQHNPSSTGNYVTLDAIASQ